MPFGRGQKGAGHGVLCGKRVRSVNDLLDPLAFLLFSLIRVQEEVPQVSCLDWLDARHSHQTNGRVRGNGGRVLGHIKLLNLPVRSPLLPSSSFT